jgi:F-type H+-transporting ATPase subunit b
MSFDESFFVALAFAVVVAAFLYLRLPSKLVAALDDRAEQIRNELEQAKKLREDAEALLAEYEAKRNAAEQQAEQIVADARANAETLAAEAKQKLEDSLERRTQQAQEKIARAEANMVKEVRLAVTSIAVTAAEQVIRDTLSDDQKQALVAANLSEIDSQFQ